MTLVTIRARGVRFVVVFLVASVAPERWASEAAAGYQFKKIIDDQGAFMSFTVNSAQPLNDGGEAAFYAVRTNFTSDMFKSNGSGATEVSTNPQHLLDSQNTGSINDGGSVAFRGDLNAFQTGLWAGSGAGLTSLLGEDLTAPDPAWLITGAVTINDSNQAAFSGGWVNSGSMPTVTRAGFYRVSGGSVTVMAETGAVYNGASSIAPALNDAGQAAFMMSTASNGYQVIRYDNPGLTTIAGGFSGSQMVSMNESGHVVFVNQNSTAVNVFRQGAVHTVVSTADGFNLFQQGDAFINDAGKVAFSSVVDMYHGVPVNWEGVFTGPDALLDRVLKIGDPLFGRTVADMELLGFNDAGQVLMSATLSGVGDVDVLFVATPPLAGDFQEDGDVDSEDLGFWKGDFGQATAARHNDGDADDDGDVDGGDFLIWQRQYGTPLPAASAVPEPTAFLLTAVALSSCDWFVRRIRRAPCRDC